MKSKLKWFFLLAILVACSTIAYQRIPVWFTRVNMPPNTLENLDYSLITAQKEIKIPSLPSAFNPAFFKKNGEYILITRFDSGSKVSFFKTVELYNGYKTQFHLIKLDQNFNPRLDTLKEISVPSEVYRAHDPRFFQIKDDLYLIFNMPIETAPVSDWLQKRVDPHRKLFIAKLLLKEDSYSLIDVKELKYPESNREIEKNWSPFVFQDELYVTYTIEPHVVLKVDIDTGLCHTLATTDYSTRWQFGELRGGTPAIETEEGFLSIFHSNYLVEENFLNPGTLPVYFAGAYLFRKEPPFDMIKMSPVPFATESFYGKTNKKKVIFPTGIIIENNQVHFALGNSDKRIEICTMPLNSLIHSMVSLNDEK